MAATIRKTPRTPRTTSSSSSAGTDSSKVPTGVLELGQYLVKQLGLDDGVDTLGRWMAHHLAELLVAAKSADVVERRAAEDRVAALIPRIWEQRHADSLRMNPLAAYVKATQVLAAIHPTTHRFAPMNPPGTPTRITLSLEAFDLASRLALLGVVELLPEMPPKVAAAVEEFLSAEERDFLRAARKTYDLLATAPVANATREKRAAPPSLSDVESVRSELLERLHAVVGTLLESPPADRQTDAGVAAPRRARTKRSR